MWLNKYITLALSALVVLTGSAVIYAQVIPTRVIEAEGIAAITGSDADAMLRARDEAIKRALRRAVEMGIGSLVDSESITQNFQLLNDEVYTHVKGYVTDYQIIRDNNGEGQIYRVTVEATVALAQLEKDLKALNIIKAQKGNPRIMVIFREMVDQTDPAYGGQVQGGIARNEMEQILLQRGFPLVDKAQTEAIKQRDATLSYTDPMQAAALGRRFGAEVVIVGEASADLVDSSRPYGAPVFFYQGQVNVRAINVDTASIIAATSAQSDWRKPGEGQASGKIEAARQALQASGRMAAEQLLPLIIEKWRSEVFNTVSIQIIAENVNGARRRAFLDELQSIRGVESVDERTFQNQIIVVDVEVEGSIWQDVDKKLEAFETVGVELTGKTQNRINIRLFDADNGTMQLPLHEENR